MRGNLTAAPVKRKRLRPRRHGALIDIEVGLKTHTRHTLAVCAKSQGGSLFEYAEFGEGEMTVPGEGA